MRNLYLAGVPLCYGISIGASVSVYPDAKGASLLPSWEGIEGCFTLYGDVDSGGKVNREAGTGGAISPGACSGVRAVL